VDAWDQAVNDVVGFACAQFQEGISPREVREAVEEILETAQETFAELGHFCAASSCRCRAETLVSLRAYVEAKVLAMNSLDAQIFAMQRLNEYLDKRS